MQGRPGSIACLLAVALTACGGGGAPRRLDDAWIADVQARAHALASIDVDAVGDADLAFLADALEGRRIVELGENTHGAAQYSRAKTRLVKYLHEQLGFDVLVWETSILSAHLVDRELDGLTAAQATLNLVPSLWHTEDVVELLAYVKSTRATARPLRLAGMDLMLSSADEAARRPQLLHDLVAAVDPEYADEVLALDGEFAARLADVWRTVYQSSETAAWERDNAVRLRDAYRELAEFLGAHQSALEAAVPADPTLPRVLRRAVLGTSTWFAAFVPGAEYRVLRDSFLADAFGVVEGELFPGRKVLVWAHDTHLYKAGTRSSGAGKDTGYVDAGQLIAERYGSDVYMLSLLAFQGEAADGLRVPYVIAPARAWSIEGLLHETGAEVAFLDLAGVGQGPERAWMDQEFPWRDFGITDIRAVPREQMDGVLWFAAVDPPVFIDP